MYELDPTVVGAAVQQIRKSRGLTQGDLGNALGISQSAASWIETGRVELRLSQLVQIAEYLGMSDTDLYEQIKRFAEWQNQNRQKSTAVESTENHRRVGPRRTYHGRDIQTGDTEGGQKRSCFTDYSESLAGLRHASQQAVPA